MLRQTLFRTMEIGVKTTAMGFYRGGERDGAQLQMQNGQVRIYGQGAEWGSLDK